MADPMTQSQQISSSQGLNDGHPKDSKFTDKRVTLDSDKPPDVLSTTLRFSSQQSSLSSVTYGNESSNRDRTFREKRELFESSIASQNQDSTPMKVSPVSERIKALEALTAKKNDSDWTDGGLSHCRERYCEKSPTEQHGITHHSSIKKKPKSPDNDSPESPFEILGSSRRGSEFEDTADWMRAHLPPAPNFNLREADYEEEDEESTPKETKSKELQTTNISEPFVGVPAEFMDMPPEEANQINDSNESGQESVDNESAFDLQFLPTAYIYDKQENSNMEAKDLACPPETQVSEVTASPVPHDDFMSPSLVSSAPYFQTVSNTTQESSIPGGGEPVEILEVDSSGESDDTVIEDSSGDCHTAGTDAPECKTSLNNEALPQKKIIQVPIINVINEPEEQVLSDYEVEQDEEDDYQIYQMHEPMTEVSQPSEYNSEVSKSEKVVDDSCSKFVADPDADYSPKHKIISDEAEGDSMNQTCFDSKSLDLEISQAQSTVSPNVDSVSGETTINTVKSATTEEVVNPNVNPNDILNEIESNDLDTYLDQLNSGIFTENNANTYELMKSNSVEGSWETTMYDQQSYDQVAINEFDQMYLESQSNYNLYPEPKLSSAGISITEEVHVDPLVSQNKTPSLEFEQLCLDIKTTDIFSADISLTEEVYVEPLVSQNKTPSLEMKEQFLDEMIIGGPPFASVLITEETHVEPLVSQNKKTSSDLEECLTKNTEIKPSANFSISEEFQFEPLISHKIPSLDFEEQCLDQNTFSASESFSLVEDNYVSSSAVELSSAEKNTPALFPSFHNDAKERITELSDFAGSDITKKLVMTNYKQDELDQSNDPDNKMLPEIRDAHESTEPESSTIAATDSFVEFMRECLKSQQDEDSKSLDPGPISQQHIPTSSSSSTAIDLEQEHPTVHAFNKLGSSQEKDELCVLKKDIPTASQAKPSQPSSKQEYSTGLIHTAPPLLNESQPDTSLTEEVEAIDIWVAEAYHLAEHVLTYLLTHLSVRDLVYWRDPKKSGVVFGTSLLLLLSLAAFSVISVISYLLLALLCVTISFRVYKAVVQAVQKTSDGHPFKELMQKDVSLSPESFRKHVDGCLTCINCGLKQMLRLFLVEDLVDSLKLAVFMWLLTYVGSVFNGITILILVDILAFTVPPLYEKYKTQIDHYIDIARTQFNNVAAKIQEKLHKGKRSKTE